MLFQEGGEEEIVLPYVSFAIFIEYALNYVFTLLKGTVSVMSRDPHCKDGSARFTMVS